MADKTITELESILSSSLSSDDELIIYEKTNGSTKKVSLGDLKILDIPTIRYGTDAPTSRPSTDVEGDIYIQVESE